MFDFNYNRDYPRRDRMIFGGQLDSYDTKKFSGLGLVTLAALLDCNFADPDMTQNNSPTIEEMYQFMLSCKEKYPGNTITAHGYVVSPDRGDYRVSIEGIECTDDEDTISTELMRDFVRFTQGADYLDISTPDRLYAWWD